MGSADSNHLNQLREAVKLSPNNPPLRRAFAEALLSSGFAAEAALEFQAALKASPEDVELKTGLARAFFADGKNNHALVVLEDVVRNAAAPARAFVLHAKLLAGIGEVQHAVEQYKRGVAKDKAAADLEFATRLGIRFEPAPEAESTFEPPPPSIQVTPTRARERWQEATAPGDAGQCLPGPGLVIAAPVACP